MLWTDIRHDPQRDGFLEAISLGATHVQRAAQLIDGLRRVVLQPKTLTQAPMHFHDDVTLGRNPLPMAIARA